MDLLEQMGLPRSHIERGAELLGDRNAGLEEVLQALREDQGETVEDAAVFGRKWRGRRRRGRDEDNHPQASSIFGNGDDNTGFRFALAARDDWTSSATLGEDDEDQDLVPASARDGPRPFDSET